MRTVALGEVARIERHGVDPRDLPGETRYLGLEHIARGGRIIGSSTVAGAELSSTKFLFTPEHVLFGKLRPNLGKVARPGFAGVCSTDILPIRPVAGLDRDYLAHYLVQPSMVDFAAARATGANLPRLSPSTLVRFPVPVPDLADQRRIAAILDAADAIRAKRRAQLAHLDDLPQAVFREIFGAPTSFQAKPLGEIATLTAGKSLVGEDLDAAAAFRVLKISAVTSGLYRPGESKPLPMGYVPPEEHIVRAGDLLMSRANTADLVGATALVVETPQYLALPDKIWRFVWRGSEIEPVYLHAFLSSAVARRKLSAMASGSGGSMKNISKAKLNRLDVPVPPLALQQEFVTKVEAIHAERARVARALEADDELFAALQHRAFRGEL